MIKTFLNFWIKFKSILIFIKKETISLFKYTKPACFPNKKVSWVLKGSPSYVILEKKDKVTEPTNVNPTNIFKDKHETTKADIVDFLKKNNPELVKKLESDAKSKGIDMNLNRFDEKKFLNQIKVLSLL